MRLLTLPESSGVREDFEEIVLGEVQRGMRPGSEITFLPASRLLERVASDRGAVGFVSSSRDRSSVRTVPIRAGESDEAVLPTPATIARDYALRHAVWLYLLGEPRAGLRRFITFLLLHDGRKLLEESGFVPVPSFGVVARHVSLPQSVPSETSVARIPFGFRARRLRRSARRRLASLAERLRGRDVVLWVAGHVEPSEALPELARARAEAVADVLAEAGWDRSRIVVQARGSREPVASNETTVGRQANRRADVWVLVR